MPPSHPRRVPFQIKTYQGIRPKITQPDPIELVHLDGIGQRPLPGQKPFAPFARRRIPHSPSPAPRQKDSQTDNCRYLFCTSIKPRQKQKSHRPAYFHLPISHFQIPISHFQIPISHFQFRISNFQFHPSPFELPTSVYNEYATSAANSPRHHQIVPSSIPVHRPRYHRKPSAAGHPFLPQPPQ